MSSYRKRWFAGIVAVMFLGPLACGAAPTASAKRTLQETPMATVATVRVAAAAEVFVPIYSSRCGVPLGITSISYDDSFYGGKTFNVVHLARHTKTKGVGLYFFQLTEQTNAYKASTGVDIFPLIRNSGQYVGNHTYNHANLVTSSSTRVRWQIGAGAPSGWLRPPGGASNASVRSIAYSLKVDVCTWTYDSRDWARVNGKFPTGAQICQKVVANAPKGAVILLHLNHSAATYVAMDCIINGLRAKGHSICRPYSATHPGVATPAKLYKLPC